jgi:predicted ATPase
MIRLIEALNFRCLRYIRQPLGSFHILVGPNASGKTTFLDVVAFLGRLVSDGLEAAINERTNNFQDLLWGREGQNFQLAIEAAIPEDRQTKLPKLKTGENKYDTIRYEVSIGRNSETKEIGILEENATLKIRSRPSETQREFFPILSSPPDTIITRRASGSRKVLTKASGGNDHFYTEGHDKSGKGWFPSIKLGPRKSALGNLPEDETRFPVSTWLKSLLAESVQSLVLNSQLIRRASPPGQIRGFKSDGANLPWVISDLRNHSEENYENWIAHLQTALPDLEGVDTVERPDDKHRYLMLRYRGGLKVPSWVASDGTLRLLALTLPAYLPNFRGVYLIEEPENGIHPRAIESLFQSLSSVYGAQILLATHSPIILSVADLSQVLCFKKTPAGETDIVIGNEHPTLRNWQGETDLGSLFASGVLG